jgi:microcystin degradation protein MlrC
MRIAIGGFLHETHSFAAHPTTWADFVQPGGWHPFIRGDGLVHALRATAAPIAGAIAALEAHELVPLSWCIANPAGPIQDEAFERICAFLCADVAAAHDARALDGVYLDLHGAGLAESFGDAEGELLRRMRGILGNVPITISVDPHANTTAEMVDRCDAIAPFRTYPHVDMKDAGARAAGLLLQRIRRGAPFAKAWRQLDFLYPLMTMCTMHAPMDALMAARERIAARHGVAELAFCFGFAFADFPGNSPAIVAYADTQAQADAAADELLALCHAREPDFVPSWKPADEAVAEALRIAAGASRPVVIADTQDNPGGGGHGDTTGLLAELIRQDARGAVLCLVNDADSAAACHAAGQGAQLPLSLGGKSDGAPLQVAARVLRLSDGKFVMTGPMAGGNPADLGPSALIEVAPDIRVILTSRKTQGYDQSMFRFLGVEPRHCRILALKSSVHFRADFAPIAEAIIVALAPGPVAADPSVFRFRHLRPGLRMVPRAA